MIRFRRVRSLADRLGISIGITYARGIASVGVRELEHVAHELGHAMLLRLPLQDEADDNLPTEVESALRRTRKRRKYRDEAHVLVATHRLLESLGCDAPFAAFEKVSREQKIRRCEWRDALRSPRARWLTARLRAYLVAEGVVA